MVFIPCADRIGSDSEAMDRIDEILSRRQQERLWRVMAAKIAMQTSVPASVAGHQATNPHGVNHAALAPAGVGLIMAPAA